MKRKKKRNGLKKIKIPRRVISVTGILIGFCLVIILGVFYARSYRVKTVMDDSSMEPTLTTYEAYTVNQLKYRLSKPKRNDIILFRIGQSEDSRTYIRRVIGLPGENVMIKDGKLFINDEEIGIKFNSELIEDGGLASLEDGVTVGLDEYFVISDNYNESEDSRFLNIGNIPKSQIIGKIK